MHNTDSRPTFTLLFSPRVPVILMLAILTCCCFSLTLPGCAEKEINAALQTQSLTNASQADNLDAIFSDFENYTKKSMKEWHVPGLAVAVVRGDRVIYTRGFGNKSQDSPDPVTPNTVFQVGSTSKAFTSALLAMQVDLGTLQWTDRVVDVLPEFQLYDPWVTREFMVKDLLDHSSGLPEHACEDMITFGYDRETIMRSLKNVEPASSFRSVSSYSNAFYLWAARLVELQSGRTWEENLQDRIFLPLQMKNTTADLKSFQEAKDVAALHRLKDNRLQDPELLTIPMNWTYMDWIYVVSPAGGINSNIIDMSKWLRLQMNDGRINDTITGNLTMLISKENVGYMHSPQTILDSDRKLFNGLGWIYEEYRPYSIVWHNGGSFGHHSMIAFVPDADIGIVVLSNSAVGLPEILAYWFFDRYFGNPLIDYSNESLTAALMLENLANNSKPRQPQPFDPPLPLESYTGNYSSEIYGPINITAEQGHLLAIMGPRKLENILYPWNREMFFTQVPQFMNMTGFAAFRLDPNGKPEYLEMTLFIERSSGRKAQFKRID
jgi:CubicO group peptidase (beta-lactamase class C family)